VSSDHSSVCRDGLDVNKEIKTEMKAVASVIRKV
jgi:hypothetical protein